MLHGSRHTLLGGEMWCWRPLQISHHQVRDELVAPRPSRMRAWLWCSVLPYYPHRCLCAFFTSQMLHGSRHTRLGGEMWCWRPLQINTHQDWYDAFFCAIPFRRRVVLPCNVVVIKGLFWLLTSNEWMNEWMYSILVSTNVIAFSITSSWVMLPRLFNLPSYKLVQNAVHPGSLKE